MGRTTTRNQRRPAHIFILNYRDADTDADPDPINCQAIILALSATASFHLSATVYFNLAIYTILCTLIMPVLV